MRECVYFRMKGIQKLQELRIYNTKCNTTYFELSIVPFTMNCAALRSLKRKISVSV